MICGSWIPSGNFSAAGGRDKKNLLEICLYRFLIKMDQSVFRQFQVWFNFFAMIVAASLLLYLAGEVWELKQKKLQLEVKQLLMRCVHCQSCHLKAFPDSPQTQVLFKHCPGQKLGTSIFYLNIEHSSSCHCTLVGFSFYP